MNKSCPQETLNNATHPQAPVLYGEYHTINIGLVEPVKFVVLLFYNFSQILGTKNYVDIYQI